MVRRMEASGLMADCPYAEPEWYCCLAAGHTGPHQSVTIGPLDPLRPIVTDGSVEAERDVERAMRRERYGEWLRGEL